jgi:magnesium transporter
MKTEAAPHAAAALLRGYVELFPDEAAHALDEATPAEAAELVAAQSAPRAADLLQRLSPDQAAAVLAASRERSARRLLERLEPGRAATLVARLEDAERDRLLALLDPPLAAEIHELSRYPADTAGALMDPVVAAFREDTRVGLVLTRLRRQRGRRVHDVFVVDENGRLTGAVSLQELALARGDAPLGDLVRVQAPRVAVTAGREEIVEAMQGGRVASLAVVAYDDRLLGVLRHATLVEAAEREASADIQSMVGASKEERALSPVGFAVKKRLPWLQINLATAFLASAVVGLFEETIQQVTALAILLPVVAGQSGNSGAQALAVTMRGLVLREVRVRSWPRVLLKELAVGAVNGVAVALVCAGAVYLWSGSLGLSAVIGSAMVIAMVVAGLAGAAIPTILSALGQDPAQSSSIILTTVTDVAGFFTFLGLARAFSGML